MTTFPFARAAESIGSLATDTDMLSSELSSVLGRFESMSGLPIDAHMDKLQHTISQTSTLAMSMSETATMCSRQDTYDADLAAAPTPAECDAAWARAKAAFNSAKAGSMSPAEAKAILSDSSAIQAARDAAVQAHAEATAGTHFEVPDGGEWRPDTCEPGSDSPWGDGSGYDGDEVDATAETPPGDDETPHAPVTPTETAPVNPELISIPDKPVPVNPGLTSVPEESSPAGTSLSSDSPASSLRSAPTYLPAAHLQNVPNQQTQSSPSWMQPTTPPTPAAAQQRPYAASPAAKRTREERAAEAWFSSGGAEPAGAAVMATATHTATPAASAVTSSSSTASAPTSQPTPTGAQPTGHQQPTGMAPGVAGQQAKGASTAAAAPKVVAAEQPEKTLEEVFNEAISKRPYETPVRDGLLGPIVNPKPGAGR